MGFADEIDHVANSKQFQRSQYNHDVDLDSKGKPNQNINNYCLPAGLVPLSYFEFL